MDVMQKPYRLSWREIQEFRRDQLRATVYWTERLGRVAPLDMLGVTLYLVAEPDVIRAMLIHHPHQLQRDPFTRRVLGRIVGEGLFMAEGESWRRQRQLMQPIFHATHIQNFAAVFVNYARQMCESWSAGDVRQLDQEMMGLALRIICQTMFRTDLEEDAARFGARMQTVMVAAEAQLRSALPIPEWLPTPGKRRQQRALDEIRSLLLDLIRARRERMRRGDEPGRDLLAMLLMAQDEAGQPLSDREVLDECMTIFVAGHETTAVGLTWTWALLLQHPHVLDRLKADIDRVVGDAPVTVEALAQLPYLTQVIKESLRIYPPAPGFGRTPTAAFTVGAHTFTPGDMLMVSTYALHHQEEFYPEPDVFRPARFTPDAEQPPRHAYMPFGAGPRTCIGNAFATLEMQLVLATMLQSVELSLAPNQEIVPDMLVTLRPKHGVRVKVERKRERCGSVASTAQVDAG